VTRVAIAGYGAIGRELTRRIARGIDGVELAAIGARDRERVAADLRALGIAARIDAIDALEPYADLVVEAAPAALLPTIAEPFLRAGKEVVVLSAGALLDNPHLVELAKECAGTITVPSGALLGLDAVGACAEAEISSVRMTTRKPVAGLVGAPALDESGVEIGPGLERPLRVFAGTARDAARGFPANLNVAVALALAGIGPDRTEVEVWADPTVTRNTHTIVVRSEVADLTMTIENVPSENPRTGRITALSVVRLLRKRGAPLRVGS